MDISLGSSFELRCQLLIARDLGYIDLSQYKWFESKILEVNRMLGIQEEAKQKMSNQMDIEKKKASSAGNKYQVSNKIFSSDFLHSIRLTFCK